MSLNRSLKVPEFNSLGRDFMSRTGTNARSYYRYSDEVGTVMPEEISNNPHENNFAKIFQAMLLSPNKSSAPSICRKPTSMDPCANSRPFVSLSYDTSSIPSIFPSLLRLTTSDSFLHCGNTARDNGNDAHQFLRNSPSYLDMEQNNAPTLTACEPPFSRIKSEDATAVSFLDEVKKSLDTTRNLEDDLFYLTDQKAFVIYKDISETELLNATNHSQTNGADSPVHESPVWRYIESFLRFFELNKKKLEKCGSMKQGLGKNEPQMRQVPSDDPFLEDPIGTGPNSKVIIKYCDVDCSQNLQAMTSYSLVPVQYLTVDVEGLFRPIGVGIRSFFILTLPTLIKEIVSEDFILTGCMVDVSGNKIPVNVLHLQDVTYSVEINPVRSGHHSIELQYGPYKLYNQALSVKAVDISNELPSFKPSSTKPFGKCSSISCNNIGYTVTVNQDESTVSCYDPSFCKIMEMTSYEVKSPLIRPVEATIDSCCRIYVTDKGDRDIKVFTHRGKYLTSFYRHKRTPRYNLNPSIVRCNDRLHLAALDSHNKVIMLYNQAGKCMKTLTCLSEEPHRLMSLDYSTDSRFIFTMNAEKVFRIDSQCHIQVQFNYRAVNSEDASNDRIAVTGQGVVIVTSAENKTLEFYKSSDLELIERRVCDFTIKDIASGYNGSIILLTTEGDVYISRPAIIGGYPLGDSKFSRLQKIIDDMEKLSRQ